jgi:hypothetical protein
MGFDAEAWERQIEEDIRAGKLDALVDAASSRACGQELCSSDERQIGVR